MSRSGSPSTVAPLFDWLVIGQVIEVNPAHAVRGPKHVVRKGKTSMLTGRRNPRVAR
jgi:site-specific recombinase XerC